MAPKYRGLSGTVGIIAQETARYTDFWQSMFALEIPPQWQTRIIYGYDILYSRNKMVAEFEGDYLLFMDDDHLVPQGLIQHLLAHDKDVVAPLCLKRYPPFRPTAHVDGKVIQWEGQQGLLEVHSTGCPGMLIRREVFDAVALSYDDPETGNSEPYWFRAGYPYPHRLAEDIDFCNRVREAGFSIWLDMSARIGHYSSACAIPHEGRPYFGFGPQGGEYQMGATFNYGAGSDTYKIPSLKAVS